MQKPTQYILPQYRFQVLNNRLVERVPSFWERLYNVIFCGGKW